MIRLEYLELFSLVIFQHGRESEERLWKCFQIVTHHHQDGSPGISFPRRSSGGILPVPIQLQHSQSALPLFPLQTIPRLAASYSLPTMNQVSYLIFKINKNNNNANSKREKNTFKDDKTMLQEKIELDRIAYLIVYRAF